MLMEISKPHVRKTKVISFGPMCLLEMPVSRGHEECWQFVPNTTATIVTDGAVYHIPYVKAKPALDWGSLAFDQL